MHQKRLTGYIGGFWISVPGRSPLSQAFQLAFATVPQRKITYADLKLQLTSFSPLSQKIHLIGFAHYGKYVNTPERFHNWLVPYGVHIYLGKNLSHKLSHQLDLLSSRSLSLMRVFNPECSKFRKVIGHCNRKNFLNQKKLPNPRTTLEERHFHRTCRHIPSHKEA